MRPKGEAGGGGKGIVKPGIYNDLSSWDYHNKPECHALSKGGIDRLESSAAHFQAQRTSKAPPEKPMVIGSAFHTYVLEPDRVEFEIAIEKTAPKIDRDKLYLEEGRALLSYEDKDMIDGMVKSLKAHETASGLIWHPKTLREQSIFWKEHTHGFLCKCRDDIMNPELGIIADLKSTKDATPHNFRRDALWYYNYFVQAKWYLTGSNAVQQDVYYQNFLFICVEKSPPYAVIVYRAPMNDIYDAGLKISPLLELYANCLKKDEWPGYPDEVIDLE